MEAVVSNGWGWKKREQGEAYTILIFIGGFGVGLGDISIAVRELFEHEGEFSGGCGCAPPADATPRLEPRNVAGGQDQEGGETIESGERSGEEIRSREGEGGFSKKHADLTSALDHEILLAYDRKL